MSIDDGWDILLLLSLFVQYHHNMHTRAVHHRQALRTQSLSINQSSAKERVKVEREAFAVAFDNTKLFRSFLRFSRPSLASSFLQAIQPRSDTKQIPPTKDQQTLVSVFPVSNFVFVFWWFLILDFGWNSEQNTVRVTRIT